MDYITTTELRTKSSQLVGALSKGAVISLLHRSKIIGEIRPKIRAVALTLKDARELKKLATSLRLPKLSYKERAKRYGKYLAVRYGQGLS